MTLDQMLGALGLVSPPGMGAVHQIELFHPDQPVMDHTIYLAEGETEGNISCLWAMDGVLTPVGELPGRELGELYRRMRELMDGERQMQQAVGHMYQMLSVSAGLKPIVATAEEFLGCPVAVCDASYNFIQISRGMEKIGYGIQGSHSHFILADSEIESLRRLHIEDKIYENTGAFVIETEDHPDSKWIFCAIRIHNVMAGYVAVCLPIQAHPTPHQLQFVTALADVCSAEMQKHEFFVTRTGMKYENFLVELLEGKFDDVNLISSRLELLDRKFCKFFCIAVLRCSQPHNSDLFNQRQMATLRRKYPNSMSVVYRDAIVLFLNQDTPVGLGEEETRPLAEFARRNGMKVGFSQPFQDILKIKNFYQQTLNALDMGELYRPQQTLYLASDLLPQYLFSNCTYTGLEAGIHHHLFRLQNCDREHHTDYIRTLRVFLDCDRNAAKAAQALHLHRSTFFYRMKRMEEMLGISLDDSRLLFLYELSFKIWDYLSH